MRLFSMASVAALCLALDLAAGGCDDGDSSPPPTSGVDRSKYLDELSPQEARQYCSWFEGNCPTGEYKCPNGATIGCLSASECAEDIQSRPSQCLVSAVEDCVAGTKGDPCQVHLIEACEAYMNCTRQSSVAAALEVPEAYRQDSRGSAEGSMSGSPPRNRHHPRALRR